MTIAVAMFFVGMVKIHLSFLHRSTLDAFLYQITHKSLASTFVTFVHGMQNFGQMWTTSLGLLLAMYVNIWVIYGVCMVLGLGFIYFLNHYFEELEDKKPEEFGFYLEEANP